MSAPITVAFRDPPDADEEARRRALEIASVLVGAPELPVALPRFGLVLLDVEAVGDAVELVLGAPSPFARARITGGRATAPGDAPDLRVSIRETIPEAARFRPHTTRIRERLEKALTREKWERIAEARTALRTLPVGVSLGFFRQIIEGTTPRAGLVRTGFACNQDCGFCWQSRKWPGYGAEQVRTWIDDLRAMGAEALGISGGEPTLDRHLLDHVRHARDLGFDRIEIETNAIQIGKHPRLAVELRDAGLTRAFVSLHSADAEVSDRATRAPGTHTRTVAGIHALLEAGLTVILNAVITAETIATLHELPGFVARTFGVGGRPSGGALGGISISTPVPPFEHALAASVHAAPEDVRAGLTRTIDAAEAHRVSIFGIDGPCGPPLCAFAADPRVTDLSPKEPLSFRVHLPECGRCRVRGSCHGVLPELVQAFGARAVAPIE